MAHVFDLSYSTDGRTLRLCRNDIPCCKRMPAKKHVHTYMDGGVSESSYCFKQSGVFC